MILDYSINTKTISEAFNNMIVTEANDLRKEFELDGFKVKFVVVKDRDWEEWQVKVYINGKYDDDCSYFALGGGPGDKQDAIDTMNAMVKNFVIPDRYKKTIKENSENSDIKIAYSPGINWTWYLAYKIVDGKAEIIVHDRSHKYDEDRGPTFETNDTYKFIETATGRIAKQLKINFNKVYDISNEKNVFQYDSFADHPEVVKLAIK